MLNRRTLRIKVMQMLFAYKQRVQANTELSEDFIREVYSPDLNSMEFQDADELARKQKIALKILAESVEAKSLPQVEEEDMEPTIDEALERISKSNSSDAQAIRKQMSEDVNQLYSAYISFLALIIEMQKLAELDSKRNHNHFVKNLLIRGLRLNKSLEKAILSASSKWEGSERAREWFRTAVAKDPVYQEYNEKSEVTFDDDYGILKYLVNKIIFKHEVIETFLEEKDLYWDENRAVIKSLVAKTLKSIDEEDPGGFSLQEVSYNFEEDKEFFVRLFDSTLELGDNELKLIGEKALNWDIDRLALIDRIVLEMAIAELINFPSIPIKVTINEYIEVSKKYSTPKSKQFINGILDVIAEELVSTGVIKKSGRGLIDNK